MNACILTEIKHMNVTYMCNYSQSVIEFYQHCQNECTYLDKNQTMYNCMTKWLCVCNYSQSITKSMDTIRMNAYILTETRYTHIIFPNWSKYATLWLNCVCNYSQSILEYYEHSQNECAHLNRNQAQTCNMWNWCKYNNISECSVNLKQAHIKN